MELSVLERGALASEPFRLLEAALVASGVDTPEGLRLYREKAATLLLDRFLKGARAEMFPESQAQALFQWLWRIKPKRYRPGAPFRLNQVLDAYLNPARQAAGNCLGLTLLYNILALGLGLRVEAVHMEDAFGLGPHVLSLLHVEDRALLHVEDRALDVENSLPQGFNYTGHRDRQGREVWGSRELVADIYLSRGNESFNLGKLELALKDYEKALWLNPRYAKVYLNKGQALAILGKEKEAERAFRQAPP